MAEESTATTATPAAEPAATPAPETPAPATNTEGQNPNPAPDSTTNAPAVGQGEGAKQDDDDPIGIAGDGSEKEGEEAKEEPKSLVPENGYITDDLVVPAGSELDQPTVEAFKGIAKKCNLPQESFNTIYNELMPYLNQRQQEQIGDVRKMFFDEARADKDIGGANFEKNLSLAKSALNKFVDPQTRSILRQSGLDCHAGIIRAFRNIALAISDDTVVKSGTSGGKQDGAKNFFYNSQMN